DQRGEPAEAGDGLLDHGFGAGLVGNVDLERLGMATALRNGARHRLRFGRIEVGYRNLGALGGEAPADCAADLAAAAGDQGHPLRQPSCGGHQFDACCTKLPSKIADFGGYGGLMMPISTSPSAIFP